MSLTIINHKNHKIDNDLSLKLENAFNLIRKVENLGDCSVNLKIVDNEEMEDLNKNIEIKMRLQMYFHLQIKIYLRRSQTN